MDATAVHRTCLTATTRDGAAAAQVKKMRKEFDSNVRFVLMNSFSTSDDTTAHLGGTHPDLVQEDGWEMVQNKSPKVDAASLEPATYEAAPEQEWCATCGHVLAPL